MALYYLGEKVRNRVLSQSLSNQHISRATGLLWPCPADASETN